MRFGQLNVGWKSSGNKKRPAKQAERLSNHCWIIDQRSNAFLHHRPDG